MKALDLFRYPLWLADLLAGGKSFKNNGIIGSEWLNQRGLHVKRMAFAERMADLRRARLNRFLDAEDREFFATNGYVLKHNALPTLTFKRLLEELETTTFRAWEMKQGGTVTRFTPLPPKVLAGLPALSDAVNLPAFQGGLRYCASVDGDPIVFMHTVLTDPADDKRDPQTFFHSDTFQPTAKAWLFLKDVEPEDGPFNYVPGSHRLTRARRDWEFRQSLSAAKHKNGHHAAGSFRITEADLEEMGLPAPIAMNVPANTLVVADTHGFHARGRSSRPALRLGLYGSLRKSAFMPFSPPDPLLLPGLRGRQAEFYVALQSMSAKMKGKKPALIDVGELKVTAPAVR
ncbi:MULTISPECIES: phytanoyl-CoA dioxygenase family protein [Pseudovibrio]|uniref:phytanoyl-CoA dioxygenase family protein n=1 Tax=Stappiaceae TaxID=2821832 RepID=UPI002366335B|nr:MULTISPECIES: phytanoyl-CoA dioxygenase family protein [Pseudovibrio]MDD7910336.1 phytanoyl-CoA dioxygenase family protein [Pseudovibrio exalbescens]MDX5594051.1 phytanoyl-CoA dioxygenase family protein [Pseudovibrio sp. SPO723]